MINAEIMALYFGGVIAFTKDTQVEASNQIMLYRKGQECNITPSILYLITSQQVPVENVKIVLRQLQQLTDGELISLSEIAAPRSAYKSGFLRMAKRNISKDKNFSLSVEIDENTSFVINQAYDMAIAEVIPMPRGVNNIINPIATHNQVNAFKWLLGKHLDLFNLIPRRLAAGRSTWGPDGYAMPPTFKKH